MDKTAAARHSENGGGILDLTHHAVHLENTESNQACKRRGEDVASVQNGDPCRQLFPSIKSGEDVQSTRVVWSLSDTQEEACQEESSEVCADSCKAADNGPDGHA